MNLQLLLAGDNVPDLELAGLCEHTGEVRPAETQWASVQPKAKWQKGEGKRKKKSIHYTFRAENQKCSINSQICVRR